MKRAVSQPILTTLNELIATCKNGEKGFREAAEDVEAPYCQFRLREFARQREKFATQLQIEVRRLGGTPDRKGTIPGIVHRGMMNLKARLPRGAHNDPLVLAECIRGEEIARNHYYEALQQSDLTDEIRTLLETQLNVISETRKKIESLQD